MDYWILYRLLWCIWLELLERRKEEKINEGEMRGKVSFFLLFGLAKKMEGKTIGEIIFFCLGSKEIRKTKIKFVLF